jgi:hypothetical protein
MITSTCSVCVQNFLHRELNRVAHVYEICGRRWVDMAENVVVTRKMACV